MKYLIKDQQGRAQLYFALILFVNLIIILVIVTGIVFGIRDYISDTRVAYDAVTCCGSICSKCFFTLHTLATALPWGCIAVFFTGICIALHKTFRMLSWNSRISRSLTLLSIENHPKFNTILSGAYPHPHIQPAFVYNSELRCAFTLGLLKPKIYVSTGICSCLTAKELFAVILHETHHKKNKAPLKLFATQILSALNFFLPINRSLISLYSSVSEKAADDSAINISGEPLELASALVKLSKSNSVDIMCPSVAFSKGQRTIEDRIRRLLYLQEITPCSGKTRSYFSCFLSLFIALTICLPLFCKFFTPINKFECKTRVCHMVKCG